MKQIFAHVTGGTYAKRISRERVAGAGVCTVRRNVALVTDATREHETRTDLNTPRTRAAVVWRIEHRDDFANTVF